MKTRYLVLRSNYPADDFRGTMGIRTVSTGGSQGGDFEIRVHEGDNADRDALLEDPRNRAVVDAGIKLALVVPASNGAGEPARAQLDETTTMANGLAAVGAHASAFVGQGVTVAVLDTGIDRAHSAFAKTPLVCRNFTQDGHGVDDVEDDEGQGTHCAGTLWGGAVDGIRIGVAPGVAKLCVGKVLGKQGGTLEALVDGLLWAVREQKATVVSMSLSYDLPGNSKRLIEAGVDEQQATQVALRQHSELSKTISTLRGFLEVQSPNVVIVAATGNESRRPDFVLDAGMPAAELLPVGAVGRRGDTWEVASFSNGSARIVAPGVDVVSVGVGGGLKTMSGTSMATPHAAGVAALWAEKLRGDGSLCIPGAVLSALIASATRVPLSGAAPGMVGAGMVQAP